MTRRSTIVLDFGKTRLKASLVGINGAIVDQVTRETSVVSGPPYPHLNIDMAWQWTLTSLRRFASTGADIGGIIPVTHGATAALIDNDGLVLPVMDYEWDVPKFHDGGYDALASDFENTLSPRLPVGLNLGRQLYWLANTYPEQFQGGTAILTYPQYWAWRLSGTAASEVTSLGCHTDLWNARARRLSRLGEAINEIVPFAPLRPAWDDFGPIVPSVAAATGLPADCRVINGVHDSNASYLRRLAGRGTIPRAVISTGTWVVVFAPDADIDDLDESRDMLGNVDIYGRPVACARFMGGREYEAITAGEGGSKQTTIETVQSIIDTGTMALPCFAPQGGPYRHRTGSIVGDPGGNRAALASVYLALMTCDIVESLHSRCDVVVEGPFAANAAFTSVLATLLEPRKLMLSDDVHGTTLGAWLLAEWKEDVALPPPQPVTPWRLKGLSAYADTWRACVQERQPS